MPVSASRPSIRRSNGSSPMTGTIASDPVGATMRRPIESNPPATAASISLDRAGVDDGEVSERQAASGGDKRTRQKSCGRLRRGSCLTRPRFCLRCSPAELLSTLTRCGASHRRSRMQEQQRDPLIEEALRWFGVLKDPKASDDDRRAFSLWLREAGARSSLASGAACLDAGRQDRSGLRRQPAGRRRHPHAAARSGKAAATAEREPVVAAGRVAPSTAETPRFADRRRRCRRRRGAGGALLWRPGWIADHATAVGERCTVALADGSTVELAGRVVDLRRLRRWHPPRRAARGRSLLQSRRRCRPAFVVEAEGTRIRAVGTAFDVKLGDGSVSVAVSEQSVDVAVEGRSPVVVGSGQQVRSSRRVLGDVRGADLAVVGAWQNDRLAFRETPLGDVVADLQRYRVGRIVLTEAPSATFRQRRIRDGPGSTPPSTRSPPRCRSAPRRFTSLRRPVAAGAEMAVRPGRPAARGCADGRRGTARPRD